MLLARTIQSTHQNPRGFLLLGGKKNVYLYTSRFMKRAALSGQFVVFKLLKTSLEKKSNASNDSATRAVVGNKQDQVDLRLLFERRHIAYFMEYEEMGSAFGYFITKMKAVSTEVADDLLQLCQSTQCYFFWDILPKEQRPPPGESNCEGDLAYLHNHFEGLAALGTHSYTKFYIQIGYLAGHWEPFIRLGIGLPWTAQFPFIDPADRHKSANFEQLWSTLLPLEQPTAGWKKAWLRPHSMGDIPEDSMDLSRESGKDWDWSYSFWDETGLMEWKSSDELGKRSITPKTFWDRLVHRSPNFP
ncbi:hypothetical protein N7486_009756 [Penicillium sp. IBT 16267x]|nr:hypothetical protein N7486_009756 [Penicillium sp. IBT 16267x]